MKEASKTIMEMLDNNSLIKSQAAIIQVIKDSSMYLNKTGDHEVAFVEQLHREHYPKYQKHRGRPFVLKTDDHRFGPHGDGNLKKGKILIWPEYYGRETVGLKIVKQVRKKLNTMFVEHDRGFNLGSVCIAAISFASTARSSLSIIAEEFGVLVKAFVLDYKDGKYFFRPEFQVDRNGRVTKIQKTKSILGHS